jgi:hydrogenase maturation protease
MTRIPILVCGNTFRGDDGVAWEIGAAIAGQKWSELVDVIYTTQLLPEHAELLHNAELAIFVDCSAIEEPGAVSEIHLEAAAELPSLFTHHLRPESLLALSRHLYGSMPRESIAITVGGERFDTGEKLSERVAAAIPCAVMMIGIAVEECCLALQ